MGMESFALQVKNELARTLLTKRCCVMWEIKAFLQVSGFLVLGENTKKILIPTEYAPVARRLFLLFKRAFNITPEIFTLHRNRLQKNHSYHIQISGKDDVDRILQEFDPFSTFRETTRRGGTLPPSALPAPPSGRETAPARKKRQNLCCRRAYLRGAFLAGGYLTNPEKEYHMEIVVPYEFYAMEIVRLLRFFDMEIRYFQRKDDFVLYLKGGEKIGDFLRIIAAHSGLLNFESIRVVKGMRNQINRLVNCETANLTKTVFASHDQIKNIYLIREKVGLENIPPSLRQAAELRLRYPEATMKELGVLADPPLSKSSVNHRFRRLNELSMKIAERDDATFHQKQDF